MVNCSSLFINTIDQACPSLELLNDLDPTLTFDERALLSAEVKIIFEYINQISLFFVTSVLGIIANVINIIVYKRQGLNESITLGFFALSVSDLVLSVLPLETSICYVLKFAFPASKIDFMSVHFVNTGWWRPCWYSISCAITALLSVERCLCVILPFKVKVIFSRSRTAHLLLFIVVFHVLCYVPIFASHRLRWQPTPSRNNSNILRIWYASHRDVIELFNITLTAIVLPTTSQVIVTCCVAVMIHGLRKSAKFRQTATTTTARKMMEKKDREIEIETPATIIADSNKVNASSSQQINENENCHYISISISSITPQGSITNSTQKLREEEVPKQNLNYQKNQPHRQSRRDNHHHQDNEDKNKRAAPFSQRDARLVRTMVFVVGVLCISNVPFLSFMYARLIEPKLSVNRAYMRTFSLISSDGFTISIPSTRVPISLSTIKTSTRYREIFNQLFKRGKQPYVDN